MAVISKIWCVQGRTARPHVARRASQKCPYPWRTTGSAYWGFAPMCGTRAFSMGMRIFGLRDLPHGYGRFSPEQTKFLRQLPLVTILFCQPAQRAGRVACAQAQRPKRFGRSGFFGHALLLEAPVTPGTARGMETVPVGELMNGLFSASRMFVFQQVHCRHQAVESHRT